MEEPIDAASKAPQIIVEEEEDTKLQPAKELLISKSEEEPIR